MAHKPTDLRPVMTRIPEALRRKLERAAAHKNQSMNAEIIERLTQSFERVDQEKMIKALVQSTATATVTEFKKTMQNNPDIVSAEPPEAPEPTENKP